MVSGAGFLYWLRQVKPGFNPGQSQELSGYPGEKPNSRYERRVLLFKWSSTEEHSAAVVMFVSCICDSVSYFFSLG